MKTNRKNKALFGALQKLIIAAGTLTAATVLAGCGSDSSSSNASNNSTVGPSSSTNPGTIDFATSCKNKGGSIVESTLCKVTTQFDPIKLNSINYGFSSSYYSYGFSLSLQTPVPSIYSSTYRVADENPLIVTGLSVKANDVVTYSLGGRYGTITGNVDSILWGLVDVYTYSTNCESRSSSSTYYDEWAGLIAHDGSKTYELRSSSGEFTVENAGTLAVGFDAPSSYNYACGSLNIYSLSVSHCEDAAGNSLACPE